jgi:hypothetical protein
MLKMPETQIHISISYVNFIWKFLNLVCVFYEIQKKMTVQLGSYNVSTLQL